MQCYINNSIIAEDNIKSVWVKTENLKDKIYICVLDRLPNASEGVTSDLSREVDRASRNGKLSSMGDFS